MSKISGKMRVAFRVEGPMWNAYAATLETMDGSILLGSIFLGAVADNSKRKQAFMDLMQAAFAVLMEGSGAEITAWNAPVRGPEHERSGNV